MCWLLFKYYNLNFISSCCVCPVKIYFLKMHQKSLSKSLCSDVCVSTHFEDLLEAVFRGCGQTQHAEVADESRGHGIAPPSRRSTRCSNGHFLEAGEKGGRE